MKEKRFFFSSTGSFGEKQARERERRQKVAALRRWSPLKISRVCVPAPAWGSKSRRQRATEAWAAATRLVEPAQPPPATRCQVRESLIIATRFGSDIHPTRKDLLRRCNIIPPFWNGWKINFILLPMFKYMKFNKLWLYEVVKIKGKR